MEGWMISFAIAVIGVVTTAAITRYQVLEHKEQLKKIWGRIDSHYKKIIEHEGALDTKPDVESLRKIFVEIEMWKLQNKHTEEKLDDMETKLLDRLDTIKRAVCPLEEG